MIRPGSVLLAVVLLLARPVNAQESNGQSRTHTVRSGESLSSIAQRYLGSPSEWVRLFDANGDQLSDPDRLQVGMSLVIPGATADGSATAAVADVEVIGPTGARQDLSLHEARRALLESRPFEPLGVPEVPLGQRSVFFDVPEPEQEARILVMEADEAVPALPRSIVLSGGWLNTASDGRPPLGELIGFADGRETTVVGATAQLYDDLYARIFAEGRPQVGNEFLSYSVTRSIEGLGSVAEPSGRVRVIEVGEGEVVVEVVQEFGRVKMGDLITRVPTFLLEPGIHPVEVERTLEGRIIALQQLKEINVPGDFAFIDRGREDGLAIGDELVGLGDPQSNWDGRPLARFVIVGLQEDVATVRIVSAVAPLAITPGLRVAVDRKMP